MLIASLLVAGCALMPEGDDAYVPTPPIPEILGPSAGVADRYPDADLVVVAQAGEDFIDEMKRVVPAEMRAEAGSMRHRATVPTSDGPALIYTWDTVRAGQVEECLAESVPYGDVPPGSGGGFITCHPPEEEAAIIAHVASVPGSPNCAVVVAAPPDAVAVHLPTPEGRHVVVVPYEGYGWVGWVGDGCPDEVVVEFADGSTIREQGPPAVCPINQLSCSDALG
jgi:hypothetical protein